MSGIKKVLSNAITKFFIKISVIALCVVAVFTFVIQVHRVTGNDNSPFIRDGDLCIFNRLSEVNLNDVVIYESPKDGKLKIGRIVAVSGQEVNMDNTDVYKVDNFIPSEEITYPTNKAEDSDVEYPLIVGKDEYFILNDFRTLTTDSREYGLISKDAIHGNLLLMLRRRGF